MSRFACTLLALFTLSVTLSAQDAARSALKDGNIYYDRQEWDKALTSFQRALRARPQWAEAQALIGSTLAQLKRMDEAVTALERSLTLSEIDDVIRVYAYKELGLIHGQRNQDEKALDAFRSGLKIDGKNEQLWRNAGISCAKLSRWSEALEAWNKSLEQNPGQPKLREWIADARRKVAAQKNETPGAGSPSSRPRPPRPPDSPAPAASQASGIVSMTFPPLGGWVFLPDGVTVIVTVPSRAELVYIDTVTGREAGRAQLEFKPGRIAMQGDTLFAAAQGSSLVHALDAGTGKSRKVIKVPGEPVFDLACHPKKGSLFASNTREEVLAIDPRTGSVMKTKARGRFLEMDPVNGAFLYTGRTSPNEWDIDVEENEKGEMTFYIDRWGCRSMIRKYGVQGRTLRLVAVNSNAAVNGRAMSLSPDGKRVAITGGGGWRPKRGGTGGGYVVAVYSTDEINTMLGQVELGAYPENIAFHPVLQVGVALKSDANLVLFNARSLTHANKWKIEKAPRGFNEPGWIGFGGRGTKIVYWQMGSSHRNEDGKLYLIPLDLTSEEVGILGKHYGDSAGDPAGPAPRGATPTSGKDPAALFNDAEAAEKDGDVEKAIALYRLVAKVDATSELGNRASRKVLELEDRRDSDTKTSASAAKARNLLMSARNLEHNGLVKPAIKYYKRLVSECPGTPEAEEAQKKIKELEKP